MTYTLTNMTTLGTVTSEYSNKDAQLFQMPMPGSDADESIVLDLFGVNRTVNIEGVYIPSTDNTYSITSIGGTAWASCTDVQKIKANITMFISELDALISGNQVSRTYHSDKSAAETVVHDGSSITGNYSIQILSVRWTAEEGAVSKVNYTISMIESQTVT